MSHHGKSVSGKGLMRIFIPVCRRQYPFITGTSTCLPLLYGRNSGRHLPFLPLLAFRFTVPPCDLSWNYFSAKVTGCPNLPNAGIRRECSVKIFLSVVERIFPHQPCPIVPATFWEQKNKSLRSQTGRTEGNKNKVKL